MAYFTGCAVWAYRGWIPSFYPEGSCSQDLLTLYTQRLSAVEGNTTFYAMPPEHSVRKWFEQMPAGFRFCPKVYKGITHEQALTSGYDMTLSMLHRLNPLKARLGPMLLQLPPSFGPDRFDELSKYLTWWPRDSWPLSVELRHPLWWSHVWFEPLKHLLVDLGVGRVLLDTRPLYEHYYDQRDCTRRKPNVPLYIDRTSSHVVIRYIGHPTAQLNASYLDAWAPRVSSWLKEGVDVYFFAHCPIEERSPFYAQSFHETLSVSYGAPLGGLPWNNLVTPAESQVSLC